MPGAQMKDFIVWNLSPCEASLMALQVRESCMQEGLCDSVKPACQE